MMKELLRNEKLMYVLEEGDDGSLFLTVVCGGVGIYELQVQLNEQEKECYLNQGVGYLDQLAGLIGKNTADFVDRAIK